MKDPEAMFFEDWFKTQEMSILEKINKDVISVFRGCFLEEELDSLDRMQSQDLWG